MRRLSDLVFNSNGFVFEPSLGEGFVLNDTGLFLLQLLRDGSSIEEASKKLSQTYAIEINQAYTDCFDFLGKLRILGFEVET